MGNFGNAKGRIGTAKPRQIKFCQIKFDKWTYAKQSLPNKVSQNKMFPPQKSLGSKHKYFKYIKLYFDICKSKNLAQKAIREPSEAHQMKFRQITSFALYWWRWS